MSADGVRLWGRSSGRLTTCRTQTDSGPRDGSVRRRSFGLTAVEEGGGIEDDVGYGHTSAAAADALELFVYTLVIFSISLHILLNLDREPINGVRLRLRGELNMSMCHGSALS